MNPTNRPKPKASTILAVIVAGIATTNAYLAMVQFAIDAIGMNPGTAYATAGVFELSLFTVAVLAREAAKDNRPNGVLLTLTWMLSAASGLFAAWHEHTLGHDIGAVFFRITVSILAALMWHLALIGERHLATGTSWADARRNRRMQDLYEATEHRLRVGPTGLRARRAEARFIRAKHRARRVTTPTVLVSQMHEWDAMGAAETATIVTARHNTARQVGAFANQQVEATIPVEVPSVPVPPVAPTAPTTNQPSAKAAKPVIAQPIPAMASVTTAVHAVDTSEALDRIANHQCAVCGTSVKPGARYCTGTNPDGTRNQKCKNKFNSPKFKDVRARVGLARAMDKVSQHADPMTATVGPLAQHGPVFA